MQSDGTPSEGRESVRSGILASIEKDAELRAGRAARILAAAGVAGVLGAVGATLLVSGHPFGHHPPGHLVVFSALWAGLLVVTFALAFLGVRTPSLPLARSATVGLLGLGLAGICGAACPEPHFLHWWAGTAIGARLSEAGGLSASAGCFGLCTALFFGVVPALLVPSRGGHAPIRPLLPAALLLILLAPGVVLQAVGTSSGVAAGWLAGTAAGAYLGVAAGLRARSAFVATRSG